jgi:hypothetical protein
MTSKSPDASSTDDVSRGESTAPTNKAGAGDSGSADSPQTETLSQLRSAISEIDQRHAEGEAGFFAGLSGLNDDDVTGGGRTGKRKSSKELGVELATKRTPAAGSVQQQEPDNGWVEGGTDSTPDFLAADDPDFSRKMQLCARLPRQWG